MVKNIESLVDYEVHRYQRYTRRVLWVIRFLQYALDILRI